MPRLPRVTGRQVIRVLERSGWYRHHQRGSHLVLKHPDKPNARVTVAVHSGEIIFPKTLLSILGQAGMSVDEFRERL
jgi:predicted RNA binding protein YcfA (HicA-like mRNA interferase family)